MRPASRAPLAAFAVVVGVAPPTATEAQPLQIVPTLVDCVEAGRAATIVASFRPPDRLARATLYFRSSGTRPWYSNEMQPQGSRMVGFIPAPRAETSEVEYSFEAVDRQAGVYRTAPFRARVVASASECPGRIAGAVRDPPAIAFAAEEGAPAVPTGFLVAGVSQSAGSAPAPAREAEASTEVPTSPTTVGPTDDSEASAEGISSGGSEEPRSGEGGFPVALAVLGAGGAAAAVVALGGSDDSGDPSAGGPPGSGPAPAPMPAPSTPGGDGFAGPWEASVVESGEHAAIACTWTSTVLFDFTVASGQELSGTAITSATQPSAPDCGGREPSGQAFPVQGQVDGERLLFRVEAPAQLGEVSYQGMLQANVITGTMRRRSGSEGSWMAQRR